jgi:hypothetical protein
MRVIAKMTVDKDTAISSSAIGKLFARPLIIIARLIAANVLTDALQGRIDNYKGRG